MADDPQNETPIYRRAGPLLFVVGFGFLPLILGIVYTVLSNNGATADYWYGAGWIIIFAAAASGVTTSIALVTVAVYHFAGGNDVRRRNIAAGAFFTLLLIAAFIAQGTWSARATRKQNFVALERDAFTLVKENWDVQRLVGNPFHLVRLRESLASDGAPIRYLFRATGSQTVYPVVLISHATTPPTMSIACVRHQDPQTSSSLMDYCH